MDNADDLTFYILLKIHPHSQDTDKFGDYLMPVYTSEEKMVENNPGIPYIIVKSKNNKLNVSVRGTGDPNI